MWAGIPQVVREIYRRWVSNLDQFQSLRLIDTGEIVPDLERGRMFTFQMGVYNVSSYSPIENSRAKLWLRSNDRGLNVEVQTNLCWAPNKGAVTINRGDREWLNLATIRPPQEDEICEDRPIAELIFPTEAGVLNPATVKFSRQRKEDQSENPDPITRQSLPVDNGPFIFGTNDIKISSSNRTLKRYDLGISRSEGELRFTVTPNRRGWIEKNTPSLLGRYDRGYGETVSLNKMNE